MEVNIQIINIPGSPVNWQWAQQVPKNQMPRLNAEQKSTAKDFGISEEEYARSVIARQYSEARYKRHADRFRELLAKAGDKHHVESADVIYDGWDDKFHCKLKINATEATLDFDASIITEALEQGDENRLSQAERDLTNAVGWLVQDVSRKRGVVSR